MDQDEGNGRRIDDVIMLVVSLGFSSHGEIRFGRSLCGVLPASSNGARVPACVQLIIQDDAPQRLQFSAAYILATATIWRGRGALASLPGQTPSTRRVAPEPETRTLEKPNARNFLAISSLSANRSTDLSASVAR